MFKCEENEYEIPVENMIKSGDLTAIDRTPMDYIWETQTNYTLNCSKPLYMSYLLNHISANVKKDLPPILDIWKGLETRVWYLIMSAFLIILLIDKMTNKILNKNIKLSLFGYIWIYCKPLLRVPENTRYMSRVPSRKYSEPSRGLRPNY